MLSFIWLHNQRTNVTAFVIWPLPATSLMQCSDIKSFFLVQVVLCAQNWVSQNSMRWEQAYNNLKEAWYLKFKLLFVRCWATKGNSGDLVTALNHICIQLISCRSVALLSLIRVQYFGFFKNNQNGWKNATQYRSYNKQYLLFRVVVQPLIKILLFELNLDVRRLVQSYPILRQCFIISIDIIINNTFCKIYIPWDYTHLNCNLQTIFLIKSS